VVNGRQKADPRAGTRLGSGGTAREEYHTGRRLAASGRNVDVTLDAAVSPAAGECYTPDVAMQVDYAKARRQLMRADPVLAELIERRGACGLADRSGEPPLRSLARALVSQQLSVKAAATIFSRFLALYPASGFPSPSQVTGTPVETLRGVGLSRQKASYLHDLCGRVESGALALETLDAMSNEQVMDTLTAVKGIGRWTAEMILIFQLGRPDILPLDDVGLLRSIQRVYGLKRRPTEKQVRRIGEKWRPYRSIASWYLWAELDQE
jgi:DNA-3-methyladenine glycosylase II